MKPILFIATCTLTCVTLCVAQPRQLDLTNPNDTRFISSTMWGIFFEDINFAADGGIYAELVKNRSFEFAHPRMGWDETMTPNTTSKTLVINRGDDFKNNPRFLRLSLAGDSVVLTNEGFRGMGVHGGKNYDFSLFAEAVSGASVTLTVKLIDTTGKSLGETTIAQWPGKWQKIKSTIKVIENCSHALLQLIWSGRGTVDIDMVSLFPQDTWYGRPGGLRADLVQVLADLKPGFIRFPGGCIVEGRDLANRYQWKKTVGPVESRSVMINRWNNEFKHKDAPDYFQSFGLGFFEYFQLAEDLGAEPLPILSCGMACQFNTAEVAPLEDLAPYIQDALDLIEFANGSATSSTWGQLRAAMGHPQPFGLELIGIGNEQWEEQYFERYAIFAKAIRAKYPEIKLVGGSGPFRAGEWFDKAWQAFDTMPVDFMDEHYYSPPQWFLNNAQRYDSYDRHGPKVFAGEYAGHGEASDESTSRNNWQSALAEAAFMTGLERNADVVRMASYAPLLAHVDAWQWRPDLIWFDNLNTYATPNYFVQKLFSNHKGHQVLSITDQGKPMTGQNKLYASAVKDTLWNELIIKLVNTSSVFQPIVINSGSLNFADSMGRLTSLSSTDLEAFNSPENPQRLVPSEKVINLVQKKINLNLDPYSVNVYKIKLK